MCLANVGDCRILGGRNEGSLHVHAIHAPQFGDGDLNVIEEDKSRDPECLNDDDAPVIAVRQAQAAQ
eukprot:7934217-Prorocentrum_lima.AAC.1